MSLVIDDVLVRNDPLGLRVPVVFDSPHSGAHYPPDFQYTCPLPLLRQAEDAFVDELYGSAPEHGATLLTALFPRSYVDVNRAIDDIDARTLIGYWEGALRPSDKSLLGNGLIWTQCRPGLPIYDGRLPTAEVAERIERYYRPYHAQLTTLIDEFAARHGAVWHLNCHSMPSSSGLSRPEPSPRPDFVLGDRDGTTADPAFVAMLGETLRRMGYRVARNAPYKGVELVRRHGQPKLGRHSVQIEINRALYMDETTLEKHAGFDRLRHHLDQLIGEICRYASHQLLDQAAE